jgi:hypothetical protein
MDRDSPCSHSGKGVSGRDSKDEIFLPSCEFIMCLHRIMDMDSESIPLLALPISTKAEEDKVRKKHASNEKVARKHNAHAKRHADSKLNRSIRNSSGIAEKKIHMIRERDRKQAMLEERAKYGPPPGAPNGGRWVWKMFTEPSTLLLCIPWSKSVEKLAYRARDGRYYTDA